MDCPWKSEKPCKFWRSARVRYPITMLSLIFFSFEGDRYTDRARGKFRIRFKVKGNDEFTGKRDDVASWESDSISGMMLMRKRN